MNERDAHAVLLVGTVERTDAERALITDADRRHAAKAAGELARWHASERRTPVAGDVFLARRAELLLARLAERQRRLVRAADALRWRPWVGIVVPLAALVFGALVQQIDDRHHINILAFPLLVIVLWNLVMYALLVLATLVSLGRGGQTATGLRSWIDRLGRGRVMRMNGTAGTAFAAFAGDWLQRSASLNRQRAARVLHVAAALLAIGAIAGLYVRGLALEYRAGWESTFLDATQVHALLSTLLGPAAQWLGMPFPTVEEIGALRFESGSGGENAARWIHWYALTVGALVVVPRLLLAAWAGARERYLSRHFPVDLADPVYARLLAGFSPHPVRLRVVPYSYTMDESAERGLTTVAHALLGDSAEVALRPSVPYGAESAAAQGLDPKDPSATMTLALFALSATPESENHGAFLDALRAAVGRIAVLVDESGYRRRLGGQAGAEQRIAERRAAWEAFCSARGLAMASLDLTTPEPTAVARAIEPLFSK
jgi:hypothetical protein